LVVLDDAASAPLHESYGEQRRDGINRSGVSLEAVIEGL
jgi:hypothetical protein